MMKSFALLALLSLLLFASIDARKDRGEYWKSITRDEPIPKAINILLGPYPTSPAASKLHEKDWAFSDSEDLDDKRDPNSQFWSWAYQTWGNSDKKELYDKQDPNSQFWSWAYQTWGNSDKKELYDKQDPKLN